ncbi:hypothetical protein LCGC14_3059460, partial [marine sediment metagenome]
CPYDEVEITLKMIVKTSGQIYIGALVQAIETVDDFGDLEDIVIGTDESNVNMFQVLDTSDNIKQLKKDNSVYAATKALFFTAGSYVDVIILVPAMIIEARLNALEDAIVKPADMLYTAALGGTKLEDGCTYLNNIGKALCKILVSDNIEYIIILVTW